MGWQRGLVTAGGIRVIPGVCAAGAARILACVAGRIRYIRRHIDLTVFGGLAEPVVLTGVRPSISRACRFTPCSSLGAELESAPANGKIATSRRRPARRPLDGQRQQEPRQRVQGHGAHEAAEQSSPARRPEQPALDEATPGPDSTVILGRCQGENTNSLRP